jgi:hypothetical protein
MTEKIVKKHQRSNAWEEAGLYWSFSEKAGLYWTEKKRGLRTSYSPAFNGPRAGRLGQGAGPAGERTENHNERVTKE